MLSTSTNNSLIIKLLTVMVILAIAFSLRLYYINHTEVDTPIRADARDYYSYAMNMKGHHVYSRTWPSSTTPEPDSLRSPGYPFFISELVQWPPTKPMVWVITFWQALLDTLTVLMTYFLARQFLGEKLALFTALCTAISPHMISATSYMLTETLFGFLMTTSFFFITIAIKKKTHSLFLSAGILLALASLTRPTIQYFIVPLTIGLFFASNRLSLNKNLLGSLLLGFFIIYTPWIARNLHVLGTTSDSTLTINTLHHGIYPDFMYQSNPQTRGIPYRHDPRSAEISTSVNSVLKEIQRRFENEPLQHLKWYLLDKPITFFSWNIIAGYGDVFIYPITRSPYLNNPTFQSLHQIMYWLHWPLVILSLFGSCAAWLPNRMLGMSKNGLFALRGLSLLVLYFITVHIIGAPFPRYSIPLRPITYILASCSINVLIRLAITKRISS